VAAASWFRKAVIGGSVVLLLLLAVIVALPLLASSQLVGDHVAEEISEWSGYRIEFGSPPVIEVWPVLRAVIDDVSASPWRRADGRPVMTAARMEIELSALAALRGSTVFKSIRITDPVLFLPDETDSLPLPEPPDGGRPARAVAEMRLLLERDGTARGGGIERSDLLGTVDFANGRIVRRGPGGETVLMEGAAGRLAWPATDKPGEFRLAGKWRGEAVVVEARSSDPLALVAGGQSTLELKLDSELATTSVNGTVRLGQVPFVSADASLKSSAVARLARWTGVRLDGDPGISAFSTAARVTGEPSRLKLENATVEIDGHKGSGALELALQGGLRRLSGSLDFDSVRLDSVMAALLPMVEGRYAGAPAPDAPGRNLELDLRLSADMARAQDLQLQDVAAAIQIKDVYAAFDILDASAFGGSIEAALRFERSSGGEGTGTLRLRASEVDGGAFSKAIGLTRPAPVGRGSLALDLVGQGKGLAALLNGGSGLVTARFGQGALAGLDIGAFLKRVDDGGFFALAEIGNGTWPVDSIELKANITHGLMRIEKAVALSGTGSLWLSGVASPLSGGLALTGGLAPPAPASPTPTAAGGTGSADQDAPRADPAAELPRFFVGGSWEEPFVSRTTPGRPGE
jgi:AsmA protein